MVATKTKPRKVKMIPGGGPVKPKKGAEVGIYETRAKAVLRQVIRERGSDYLKLQAGLKKLGVEITSDALETKISRGTFSAAFLLQCMDALGTTELSVGQ